MPGPACAPTILRAMSKTMHDFGEEAVAEAKRRGATEASFTCRETKPGEALWDLQANPGDVLWTFSVSMNGKTYEKTLLAREGLLAFMPQVLEAFWKSSPFAPEDLPAPPPPVA
jgi:hypothetical protein